ncbi:hypothetical protein [Burkholderia ubonensis]|nr:hypothetical protein [Burkholderia ubonensis]
MPSALNMVHHLRQAMQPFGDLRAHRIVRRIGRTGDAKAVDQQKQHQRAD